MPKALEALAALKGRWAAVSDRASLDHPAINVAPGDLVAVLRSLRDEHGFDMLTDISGVDWAVGAHPRFTVVYHVFSTQAHEYVRVAADCADAGAPEVPSAAALWPGADWHEREAYDMYGIRFTGHPDLRRILMWDGYPHHPLRKEFPLAGIDAPLSDAAVAAETNVNLIPAPMAGGPFVASAGEMNLGAAEPEAKDESWNEGKPKPE